MLRLKGANRLINSPNLLIRTPPWGFAIFQLRPNIWFLWRMAVFKTHARVALIHLNGYLPLSISFPLLFTNRTLVAMRLTRDFPHTSSRFSSKNGPVGVRESAPVRN